MDGALVDLVFDFLTKYGDDIAQAYKTLAQEKEHLPFPDLAIGDFPLPKLVAAHLEFLSPDLAKDFEQRVILKTALQKKRACSSTASNEATSAAKKYHPICWAQSDCFASSQSASSSHDTSVSEVKNKPGEKAEEDEIQCIGEKKSRPTRTAQREASGFERRSSSRVGSSSRNRVFHVDKGATGSRSGGLDLSPSLDDFTDFKLRARFYDLEIRFGSATPPSNGHPVGVECRKCSHTNQWCFTLASAHEGSDFMVSRKDVVWVKFGASSDLQLLVLVFLPTIAFAGKVTEQLALNQAKGEVLDPQSSVFGARVILVNFTSRDLADKRKFNRDFCGYFGELKDIGKLESQQIAEFLRLSDRAKADLQAISAVSGGPRPENRSGVVRHFYCDHLGIGAFLKRNCLLFMRPESNRFNVIPDKYEMHRLAVLKANCVEFFQLDPESHVVNLEMMSNLGVDLCATLTRVLSAKAKEDMVTASKSVRSASLRIRFTADTDMNDVRSWFLKTGLREETLEVDFAASIFPELGKRIAPAPGDVSVVKEVQRMKQKKGSR